MILTIDIGNTSTTVGLFEKSGKLALRSSLETDKGKTTDQCAVDLLSVFHLYEANIKLVSGAMISSVVPPLTAILSDAVKLLIGKPPMIVGPGVKTGLNIRSEMHNQLGADIVTSAVAALQKYPSPIIVIDMGTATTMTVLLDATCQGCVIIPGVHIALEALSERAAELPHISIEPPTAIIGRNTIEAMRSGVVYGNAGMVDSMIERLEEATAPAATVVATGGNASKILPYCKRTIIYDRDLVLDGLYLLYQKNAERYRK
jgi:type III pantothenate kinase